MLAVLAIATPLLSGCGAGNFEAAACPVPVVYSRETMLQAARELDAMPRPSVVADQLIPDYGRLRDQARTCRGERP